MATKLIIFSELSKSFGKKSTVKWYFREFPIPSREFPCKNTQNPFGYMKFWSIFAASKMINVEFKK